MKTFHYDFKECPHANAWRFIANKEYWDARTSALFEELGLEMWPMRQGPFRKQWRVFEKHVQDQHQKIQNSRQSGNIKTCFESLEMGRCS